MPVSISGAGSISGLDQGFNVTTGSVGVGTTNPRTDLQVGAFSGGDSNIQLATGTSGASNILFGDGSGGSDFYKGFIKYNHSTDNLELYTTDDLIHFTGGSERLRIDSAGNVGVNETTPDSKIDIVYHTSENSATANLIHLRADPGASYVTRGLFVKVGRDGAYDNSAVHYDIVGSSGNSGFHAFEVQGNEKLRITKDGKVGINETSPTARLDINHPNTDQGLVVRSRYGNINTAMVKFDGDPDSDGGDGNVLHLHGGSSRTDSEILHINSTGEGTCFQIRGDGLTRVYKQLQLEHSSNVAKIIFNEYGANDPKAQIEMDQVSSSAGQLIFRTQNSGTLSERLRITSAGLVGVNCTPLAQFQVKTGTNQNIALSSMSSEASIEAFNDAGSANVPLRLRGEDFKFYTSSTERVRINQNGCLQVGSPSGTPSHLMEIRTASGDPEVIAYAPTGQKTIFNCTGSNRFALERGYNSVFEIQDPNGNGVRSDLRFDGNIILNKSMGDTNNSAVQLYRLIGPQNLSLGSGMAILGNQTDTMSTKAARITTSNSNGTAWFGPYGTIHPGSYTAMFHMKVSNNSNTSTIIRIDVSGQGITDAGGYGVHRPRVLNLAPSHFDNSDRYQYVGLDFNFVNPVATNVIEVRGLNFNNSRGADLYLDHILIVPRIPSHDG